MALYFQLSLNHEFHFIEFISLFFAFIISTIIFKFWIIIFGFIFKDFAKIFLVLQLHWFDPIMLFFTIYLHYFFIKIFQVFIHLILGSNFRLLIFQFYYHFI